MDMFIAFRGSGGIVDVAEKDAERNGQDELAFFRELKSGPNQEDFAELIRVWKLKPARPAKSVPARPASSRGRSAAALHQSGRPAARSTLESLWSPSLGWSNRASERQDLRMRVARGPCRCVSARQSVLLPRRLA
eukprot:6539184-Alexandrium_andersonii.AAC.1